MNAPAPPPSSGDEPRAQLSAALEGCTIVIAVDRRSLELAAALERHGAQVRHAPALTIVPHIDDDALVACFSEEVSADVVTQIAKLQPLRAVFRDSSFKSDADRINAEQIFRELSPGTEVKTI